HIPTTVALFDAVFVLGSSKRLEEELRRLTATTVGEIMARGVPTVAESTRVDEVAALMAERDVYTLPVVGAGGELLGVIGKIDVIRSLAAR
ncbi:MAG: CBS domain-containing protein, partial [Deferrisomatales bacterium]